MNRKRWWSLHQAPGCDHNSCERRTRRVQGLWRKNRGSTDSICRQGGNQGTLWVNTHTLPTLQLLHSPFWQEISKKLNRTSEAYENVSNVWKKKQVRGRLPNNCQSAEGQLSIPVKAGGGQAQGEAIIRDPLCLLQSALERRILTFPPLANDLKNQAIACNHVL